MDLYSLGFLFIFLPLGALTYYLLRGRARGIFLLLLSFLFVALLSPLFLLLMVITVGLDYLLAKPIAYAHPKARAMLFFCVAKDLLLFVVCSSLIELDRLYLPLSISIAAFTSLGYVTDLYHGETDLIEDPVAYGLFCCFFGKLYVGPIVTANEFIPQVEKASLTTDGVRGGMVLLIRGLAKKVILADSLWELILRFQTLSSESPTVLGTWLTIICYILYIYFLLSGFSDMATGTGAIFGLDLPENFHHPLQSSSVTDFFSRFNISANHFVRKYVYQALGAEDNGPLSTSVNILLTTMLMGLWYGIRLNYLVWGAFLGIFIIIEVLYIEKHADLIPAPLCRAYTFVAILISFCWFCGDSLRASAHALQVMFGAGHIPGINSGCLYLLESHWLLLLVSIYFCTGLSAPLHKRFTRQHPDAARIISLTANLLLLATALAYMV